MAELTSEMRQAVVKSLIENMNDSYIFSDKAAEFDAYAHRKLEAGQYDLHSDADNFAAELTADLASIVQDKHLRVNYMPDFFEDLIKHGDDENYEPSPEQIAEYVSSSQYHNNDFQKVERLTGNVGYIRLDGFAYPHHAGDTAEAAMAFVAYCDALIFDLRYNRGGAPAMIQLITSYLFDHMTHLNNFYNRKKDETTQFHTQVWVSGKKMPKVPVYVLTSSRTFSAAEEFTYNLQNLKRATIIGETTGGGAHPVSPFALTDGFVVALCQARAVNPISGTNWEGTGITPDIEIPQEEALQKAHIHALETLVETSTSDKEKAKRQWELDNVKAKYCPVEVDMATLERYTGRYGNFNFEVHEGHLIYLDRGFLCQLVAISQCRFVDLNFTYSDNRHFEFVVGTNGNITLKVFSRDEDHVMTFARSDT